MRGMFLALGALVSFIFSFDSLSVKSDIPEGYQENMFQSLVKSHMVEEDKVPQLEEELRGKYVRRVNGQYVSTFDRLNRPGDPNKLEDLSPLDFKVFFDTSYPYTPRAAYVERRQKQREEQAEQKRIEAERAAEAKKNQSKRSFFSFWRFFHSTTSV